MALKAGLTSTHDAVLLTCVECHDIKTLDEMQNPNPYRRYCIECKRKLSRELYIANRVKRNAQKKAYRQSDRGKLIAKKISKRVEIEKRDMRLAHYKVRDALVSGKLVKMSCMRCGETKVHAHHHLGYEREHQLDVQWLCDIHHKDAHGFTLESKGVL